MGQRAGFGRGDLQKLNVMYPANLTQLNNQTSIRREVNNIYNQNANP